VNSPARVSRRTVRPRSTPLVLNGHPFFLRGASLLTSRTVIGHPVSGSFHPPHGVLFSFPSRYLVRYRSRDVFSLGGQWPPASHGKTKPWYSSPRQGPPQFRLRGYHPLRRGFPAHFGYCGSAPRARSPAEGSTTPHPRRLIAGGFGLGYPPFGRPYSGDPDWFLLLPLLRCFRSGGSRPLNGVAGGC